MLSRFRNPLTTGRLLKAAPVAHLVHPCTWINGCDYPVQPVAKLGQDDGRRYASSASVPGQHNCDQNDIWMSGKSNAVNGAHIDPPTKDYDPRWKSSEAGHVDRAIRPLSHFDLLSLGIATLTNKRLRALAEIIFPYYQRTAEAPAWALSDLRSIGQALLTGSPAELSTLDAVELPKQMLSAQILSAYGRKSLVSQKDWARCLFIIGIQQYRGIDADLRPETPGYHSICYKEYAELLDLLQLWIIFFQTHQHPAQRERISLRTVIDHAANKMPQDSSYPHRLLGFAPEWPSQDDSHSDQHIVFSSFITLTIMVKIRQRMLNGMGRGAASAAPGSFLNLRNVSALEAIFMHIVGRAAQSAPVNRIYLRLGLSQLGLTAHESRDFSTTAEHLHGHADYVMMESERCLSSIETVMRTNSSAGNSEESCQTTNERIDPGQMAHHEHYPFDAGRAPLPLLYWIEHAEPDELEMFYQTFRKATKDSIVEPGLAIVDAIIRRALAYAQQPLVQGNADAYILEYLTGWFSHLSGRPSQALAEALLAHFRGKNDAVGFIRMWHILLKFRMWTTLLDSAKSWLTYLYEASRYRGALELHRKALAAISFGRIMPDEQRQRLALTLTHECLSLCLEGRPQPAKARYFHANLLKAHFEPDRYIWRQWMRLSLLTGNTIGFNVALRRYNNLPGDFEPLEEESLLYLKNRLRIFASQEPTFIKVVMNNISRAIRIWHSEKPPPLQHSKGPRASIPREAWETFVKAHSYLVMNVCDSMLFPNKLKFAACIHKHLLDCVSLELLPAPLIAEVVKMEERIERLCWDSPIEDQTRFLGQTYESFPEKRAKLPVVIAQNLVAKWLAQRFKAKGLRYDLGTRRFASLEAHIQHLLFKAGSPSQSSVLADKERIGKEIRAIRSNPRIPEQRKRIDIAWRQERLLKLDALEELHFQLRQVNLAVYHIFVAGLRTAGSRSVTVPPPMSEDIAMHARLRLKKMEKDTMPVERLQGYISLTEERPGLLFQGSRSVEPAYGSSSGKADRPKPIVGTILTRSPRSPRSRACGKGRVGLRKRSRRTDTSFNSRSTTLQQSKHRQGNQEEICQNKGLLCS